MAPDPDQPPRYTRYRARRQLLARHADDGERLPPEARGADRLATWRTRITRKRVALGLLGLVIGWLALSFLLFLVSSHFERTSPPPDVAGVLDPAGFPLTSANNILALGSDRRQKNSKEPGAEKTGPGRSASIMLIRTGGGHAARLPIPRDTIIEIPGHGLQKINAAHVFGGPALSISVIKHWLGIPINHVVEVNFENFPQLIDAMGGVDYTGGCIISRLDGGFRNGGYTLRLAKGTHHPDGQAALAPARARAEGRAPGHPPPGWQGCARAGADARERLCPGPDRSAAPGTPAGAVRRHQEPAAVPVGLLPPAMDRMERPASDHLGHERTDPRGPIWGASHRRHAAHARVQPSTARQPARRGGRPHRHGSIPPRGGRAIHERLSARRRPSPMSSGGVPLARPRLSSWTRSSLSPWTWSPVTCRSHCPSRPWPCLRRRRRKSRRPQKIRPWRNRWRTMTPPQRRRSPAGDCVSRSRWCRSRCP